MPSLYEDIGKYGEASQGRPVKARKDGRCLICQHEYLKGVRVVKLPHSYHHVHPDCAYAPVTIRHIDD